jgi:hypothetical protein
MDPIIPLVRREPFDDPAWLFELKYDGFRGIADTIRGRMLSKSKNRMTRFESLLRPCPGSASSTAFGMLRIECPKLGAVGQRIVPSSLGIGGLVALSRSH